MHNSATNLPLQPKEAARTWVVIVAGGSGTRMGSTQPKQFIELHGKPILAHTIEKFAAAGITNIVVVLPGSALEQWAELRTQYNVLAPHIVVAGGSSRTASVREGLAVVPDNGLVAVHDGVRPLITTHLIVNAIRAAAQHGTAVPVVAVKDSLRHIQDGRNTAADRNTLVAVQTPQVFNISIIKGAYAKLQDTDVSDDATVVERAGHYIHLTEGDYRNIKITTPEDLLVAEALLTA